MMRDFKAPRWKIMLGDIWYARHYIGEFVTALILFGAVLILIPVICAMLH